MTTDRRSKKPQSNITPIKSRRGPKPGFKLQKASSIDDQQSYPLMWYIAAEAQTKGDTPLQLADKLGIGYSYLVHLLNGRRPTTGLSRKVLISCARYLDEPVAQAYLWAGALESSDFIHESHFKEYEGEMIDVMSRHPDWGGFMPTKASWDALPDKTKQLIVMMFEQLTGHQLTVKPQSE